MGCLNSDGSFKHWFGNIHLSGPCNRSCYFCIGQHMMALDGLNTLNTWPLIGLDRFVDECHVHGVREIFLTGSNTDPMLFQHVDKLRDHLAGFTLGVRTNGVAVRSHPDRWACFDKASITICSIDDDMYRRMMGCGEAPDVAALLMLPGPRDVKVNIVLGPENKGWVKGGVFETLDYLARCGIKRVNLREPYGQPHIGDPFTWRAPRKTALGMPVHDYLGMEVTYWDVHSCEVESVNLYANGRISLDYPITRGHDPAGTVKDQAQFSGGRISEQWITLKT